MVDFLVFNELSLPLNIHTIQSTFELFNSLLEELRKRNINSLRSKIDIKDWEILDGETFQIYFGKLPNSEFKQKLRSLIANRFFPIETPIITSHEKNQLFMGFEYNYDDQLSFGLGCCDILDSISISFKSDDKWNKPILNVTMQYLEDETVELKHTQKEIRNCCSKDQLETHKEYFENIKKLVISEITTLNFWDKRTDLFSKIKFCKEVENSIKKVPRDVLTTSLKKLLSIESEEKSITDFNYSKESDTVFNDPDLKQMRIFTLPNGEREFFTFHIKSLPNGYRMYFLEKDSNLYIGYIGKHLKTKKY